MSSAPSSQHTNLGDCPSCRQKNVPLKEVYGVPVCEKCSKKMFSEKVRRRIQEAFERQQEQKKRELWNKRIEIIKKGIKLSSEKKPAEALKSFREYIAILENHHRVPPGGLSPHLFSKKEAGDILMISGIYWDMAKIYDQNNKIPELQQALNKYVEFSINRPHAVLSAQAIQKYISKGKAKNKEAFIAAHKVLLSNMKKCFIANAVYEDDISKLKLLYWFRDKKLRKSKLGRIFTLKYYELSPHFLKIIIQNNFLKNFIKKILDIILIGIKILKNFSNE
jgi:hypothetical protein